MTKFHSLVTFLLRKTNLEQWFSNQEPGLEILEEALCMRYGKDVGSFLFGRLKLESSHFNIDLALYADTYIDFSVSMGVEKPLDSLSKRELIELVKKLRKQISEN